VGVGAIGIGDTGAQPRDNATIVSPATAGFYD
jgi:hypothetical protein